MKKAVDVLANLGCLFLGCWAAPRWGVWHAFAIVIGTVAIYAIVAAAHETDGGRR